MSSSPGSEADAVAREAARLLASGRASDLDAAIRMAQQAMAPPARAGRARPTHLRVRRHAQAMSMQAIGEDAYRERARQWLALAEDIMTALEQAFPETDTLLVGRAAEGHFDADPQIHVRVRTERSTSELAEALSQYGYDDVDFGFTTMGARGGRLSQIEWIEDEARIILTRCPQSSVFESATDLKTGKPLARLTLAELRAQLGTPGH